MRLAGIAASSSLVTGQSFHSPYTFDFQRIRLMKSPWTSLLVSVPISPIPKPQLRARAIRTRLVSVPYSQRVFNSSLV